MVTYEQRVSKIKTFDDIGKQLMLAKQTVMRLRREAKAMPTLALALKKSEQQREAERILRTLRANIFDLEDSVQ